MLFQLTIFLSPYLISCFHFLSFFHCYSLSSFSSLLLLFVLYIFQSFLGLQTYICIFSLYLFSHQLIIISVYSYPCFIIIHFQIYLSSLALIFFSICIFQNLPSLLDLIHNLPDNFHSSLECVQLHREFLILKILWWVSCCHAVGLWISVVGCSVSLWFPRVNITTLHSCCFLMDKHLLLPYFHYIISLSSLTYTFTALHTIQYAMQDHNDDDTTRTMTQTILRLLQPPPMMPLSRPPLVHQKAWRSPVAGGLTTKSSSSSTTLNQIVLCKRSHLEKIRIQQGLCHRKVEGCKSMSL